MMQFHILSFEGPDPYSRVGGLASRIEGLTGSLAGQGFEVHLWFVGDPDLPGHERRGNLHLHRWCQWVSRHHRGGVYDGEHGKAREYAASLPPYLMEHFILPCALEGGRTVVMAEEWQTVDAVLHLDWLLRMTLWRHRVSIAWTANNTFGFDGIDWKRLQQAAGINTVSRYMKQVMQGCGISAVVIPNGLPPDAYEAPDRNAVARLRRAWRGRTALAKMARWDPDKRWLQSVDLTVELKRQGWRPLLLARGGSEPFGRIVLERARKLGLTVVDRVNAGGGLPGLVQSMEHSEDADIINLLTPVDPRGRRVLFRAADAVLANSRHEPFGLVGLETMAAGGIACTGCSGEDYAVAGCNAVVLQSDDPREFVNLYGRLRRCPTEISAMRRAGRSTARMYSWDEVVARNLLPQLDLLSQRDGGGAPTTVRALPAPERAGRKRAAGQGEPRQRRLALASKAGPPN